MYIYFHIPFCASICSYCDFPKVLYDKKYIYNYLKALEKEIDARYKNEEVKTIYIGGGTPTSLALDELKMLLEITTKFKRKNLIEFTIESNVECLDIDKINLLKEYGVNRVSLGVQSFNNNTLKELNRKHTKEDVFDVVSNLKKVGINNISIDYIYGVNSNIEELKEDINTFFKLDVPHISCYSLIIEDGTIFGINKKKYIDEEKELEMYKYIENTLDKNNYKHYEISNYAKDDFYSIHNINYWNNGNYYGFGMGAVSYLNKNRITNTKSLTNYIDGNYQYENTYEDKLLEISNTFMLGFRLVKGIDTDMFYKRYNIKVTDLEVVNKLLKEEKLILKDNRLFISPKYFYLSNEIIMEFI